MCAKDFFNNVHLFSPIFNNTPTAGPGPASHWSPRRPESARRVSHNLVYCNTIFSLIQLVHEKLTIFTGPSQLQCLHNCKIMVNLAHCTRTQVPFWFVHNFHIFLRQNPPFLSTPKNLDFHRKSSYAPSYPHYPQSFSSFHILPMTKLFHPHFCELVINLPDSTKNLEIPLTFSKGRI